MALHTGTYLAWDYKVRVAIMRPGLISAPCGAGTLALPTVELCVQSGRTRQGKGTGNGPGKGR
jgi:hypothetical protein